MTRALGLLVAAALLLPGSVAAQPVATAETLFQEGKAALLKGDYERACPLLEESYNLDRAGGALQNLALCLENSNKFASAYARWQELKSLSAKAKPPRVDRIELAEEHAAALLSKISKVYVVMPKQNRVAGLKLSIDDVAYGVASWEAGIALDPGEHKLEVTALDRAPFATPLNVKVRQTTLRVNVPVLAEQLRPQVAAERHRSARTLRTAGFVTGAAGLSLAAVGSVFGVLAMTTNNKAEGVCTRAEGVCYSPEENLERANGLRSDARAMANVANVLIPVGVIAVGVGGVLIWQGSKREPGQRKAAVELRTSGLGVSAVGEF